jgi:amino acid adenylation domain-containing protein
LTYAELNRRANRLAHHLRSLGVGRGTRVAMCVERSPEMVVCALAVLKAGGAYVPLDPSYPRERLAFLLQDVRAPVLVTESRLLPELPPSAAHCVLLDGHADQIARASEADLGHTSEPLDPAYVIYTSGSTGKPKGVVVPQRAVMRLVFGIEYVDLGPEVRILALSPIAFDASTFDLWGALLHGGTCVVFPERVPAARALARTIAEEGVTTVFVTTALFNAVVDEQPEAFAPVRQLLTGGEKVSMPHVARALQRLPHIELRHVYGPTECTTFSTWHPISRDLARYGGTIPIGRPIGNTTAYVVDRAFNPVPVGVAGELYIGGPGLALGYLDREELTAQRFVRNPFEADPGARLYRTGDLVRWTEDGELEFLGRDDDQVKIRGHRIELGEVQSVLSEHPGVEKVFVTVHESTEAGKRLVAYVVARPGLQGGTEGLASFLQSRLPEYMLPAAYVLIDRLPLNANGKVERSSLPEPSFQRATGGARVAPRNEVERHLAEVWQRVLGLDDVAVFDDFFELGGHSLLAVRLLSEVKDVFGQELPLSSLIDAPTIASQAQELHRGVGSAEASCLVKLQPRGRKPPVFCVCSLGGTVLNQRPLAVRLGSDQPFYGLQALNLDEELGRPAEIADYARRYIEVLRQVSPHGPT